MFGYQETQLSVGVNPVAASNLLFRPQPVHEPSSVSFFDPPSQSQDESVLVYRESDVEVGTPMSPPSAIGVSLASAGLLFGVAATSNTDDGFNVWTTGLSGRRGGHDFSTPNSALASLLGQKKYRRVSELTIYARTVSPSERCFFFLLLLVTLIYALGILTALVLLCFHMWIFR